MDFGLKGKKALVCGGSKGLGYATAAALAQEQAAVCILGRDHDSLKAAADNLRKLTSESVLLVVCDLLSAESRQSSIDLIKSTWGSLDILIHNVGGPKATNAEETGVDAWRDGFDRLFLPVVDFNAAFLPDMKERKWGRIVTVTSLSVVEPIPMLAVSNAFRSASTAMSKSLADEVARFGITVNCVAPGLIATDRMEELAKVRRSKSGHTAEEYEAEVNKGIPAARVGRPEEFGATVCFLCSQQASYITGSTICVDGGKRRATY
jgi:3-oxoacyl-[acyl-carrier protein] reductase